MDNTKTTLPMMAMKEVPTPGPNAQPITGLIKQSGKITGYQLADGRKLEKGEAVSLARQGGISGVGIAARKDTEYLKSLPDGAQNNNLSSLPTVE